MDQEEFAAFISALLSATRDPEVSAALRRKAYAAMPESVIDAASSDEGSAEAALSVSLDHGKAADPNALFHDLCDAEFLDAVAGIAETAIRPVIEDLRSGQVEASMEMRNAIDGTIVRGWIEETNMPRAAAAVLLPSIMGPEPVAGMRESMGATIQLAIRVFAHRQIAGPNSVEAFGMADFVAYGAALGRLADDLAAEPLGRVKAPEIAVLWRLAYEMRLADEQREGSEPPGLVH